MFALTKQKSLEDYLRRILENEGKYVANMKNAAVLVPLSLHKNLYITFIKRSKRLRFHRGEIAFPGGLQEDDENPVETALREAWEELKIQKNDVVILGFLPPTKTLTTNIHIIPVIGLIPFNYPFKPNTNEIEKVLQIPVKDLYKNVYEDLFGKYYLYRGYRIWGATARILTNLLNRLKKIINNSPHGYFI